MTDNTDKASRMLSLRVIIEALAVAGILLCGLALALFRRRSGEMVDEL